MANLAKFKRQKATIGKRVSDNKLLEIILGQPHNTNKGETTTSPTDD